LTINISSDFARLDSEKVTNFSQSAGLGDTAWPTPSL
jgi:hypothetical protein